VTRDEVVQALTAWIRVEYGKLLALREVRRVRRAAGTTWLAKIVVPASTTEVPIGELEIDEEGNILNAITIDQVLDAIRKPAEVAAEGFGDMAEGLGDLLDMGEPASRLDEDIEKLDPNKLYAKAALLASSSEESSLKQARDLMPRLLSDPEKRAAVLVWMAVVERKLNNIPIALQHLEAAAREFADRFDLPALEKLAALSRELMGDGYETSPIKRLLDDSREKMRPVKTIFECPQFLNLSADDQDYLAESMKIRELKPGADLVREGEPSRTVFVIKSGLIGVHLEKPEGGTRLVRTCYPGWLLGESSVLVADDPRCTATLRAEKPSEVWVIDAGVLKEIMAENPDVKYRIEATKHLHRIDSFFSMHETLAQLEAIVRDDLLACIQRIVSFEKDTTLIPANEAPKIACLILKGEIAIHEGDSRGAPLAVIPADRFLGVRDAMHAIAPATSAVARAGSNIAFFDAEMLRALGERSAENVIAVLERLG
jgi:CRP-like cAMP-binding protein